MKFKNKFLSLAVFTILLILSLSVVSANENVILEDTLTDSETEEIALDNTNEELSSGNTIYISPDGKGSGSSESDPTNWNEAFTKINSGDTIQFSNGTFKNIQGTIDKDIELKGSGNTTIDAEKNDGFFTIGGKYSTVKLTNLKFINAYTGKTEGTPDGNKTGFDGEGAIVNGGTLYIYNCYFASNQGIGTKGGAIHNAGTCYVYNSEFVGNGGKKGGAFYCENNAKLYLYNSIVNKCISKEGSAVHAKDGAYVEIHNCQIVNASAKNGLFYIKESTVKFFDSYFYNCRAVDTAAIIDVDKKSTVEVDNCTFDKLTATGGQVWFSDGKKYGVGNGGAILVDKDARITIKNSRFTNCNAKADGGAIYVETGATATIDNCTFKSNTAGNSGNHVYSAGYSTTITNSKFEITSTIETSDIEYGDAEIVKITYEPLTNSILNPTVYLVLDGKSQNPVSYAGSVTLKDLALGDHTVSLTATDSTTNTYTFSQPSSLFVVGGENIIVNVEYSILTDGSVNVKVTDEYGRNVVNKDITVTINNIDFTSKTDSTGNAKITPNLEAGEYNINIKVSGKEVSESSPSKITLPDTTQPTTDKVSVKFAYGADGSVEASVVDENGRVIVDCPVTLTINGEIYTNKTNSNGVAVFYPKNLDAGNYNATVSVDGKTVSNNHAEIKIMPSSSVSSIIADDMRRGYASSYDFKAKFLDKNANPLKNKTVVFIVNGNEYEVKTDEFGYAVFANKLLAGTYDITAQNPATSEELTKKLTIVSRFTGNTNIKMDYTYSATYKVRVYADNGNPVGAGEKVVIYVNGKANTKFTDKNGYVSLNIKNNNLVPKTYTITSEYKGIKVSNKLVVKQILKSKNMKYKRYKVKKFTATLKTSSGSAIKGKKVTFKIKGKTYTAKTNKKGVATIKIKGLYKLGKHKITIKYLKTSITKTVTIKR